MNTGHVLVLEDDMDWRDRHEFYLQKHGYQVKAVSTAAEAIAAVQTDGAELIRYVLLDQVLTSQELKAVGISSYGSSTGVDVLNALREMPRKHPLRFAMITESSTKKATAAATSLAESVELFVVEHEALQRKVGLETLLLAKHRFEDQKRRHDAYEELAQYFASPSAVTNTGNTPIRRLVVGLGFEESTLDTFLSRAKFPAEKVKAILCGQRVLELADFVAHVGTNASESDLPKLCETTLKGLLTNKTGERFATWKPGDGAIPISEWIITRGVAAQVGTAGQPEPTWEPVPTWNTFPPAELQILDVLAFQAERAHVVGRTPSREFDPQLYNGTDIAPEEEELGALAQRVGSRQEREAVTEDFLSTDGDEDALPGVQWNDRSGEAHAQRVSSRISILKKKLSDKKMPNDEKKPNDKKELVRLGLGPRELILQRFEQTGVYRASFDTRLVFFVAKPRDKGGRPKSANPRKSR